MERKTKNKYDGRSFFDIFSEKFFFLLKNGMFGNFFTSYDEVNDKYLQAVRRRKKNVGRRKIKKTMSRAIESSVLVKAIPKAAEWFMRISSRSYGLMLLVMGAIIAGLYFLNGYILFLNITFEMFVSGVSVFAIGIPFMLSGKSISYSIYNSRLLNALFFDFLGLDKEKMRHVSEKPRVSILNLAFFIGGGLGILSVFVMPLKLIGIIGLVVLAYCVLCRPEAGVIVTIISLPFTSVNVLLFCVLYVFVCYVLKCVVGRRTFKFEYFDIWMVVAILVVLLRGAVSINLGVSIPNALESAALMMFYFVLTNLIYSKKWFRRCLVSLVFSGLATAIFAVLKIIVEKISVHVSELSEFLNLMQKTNGIFEESNVFAHYLAAIIPFSLVHFISERSGGKKFSGIIIGAIMFAALCLTNSFSGVIGIICATLLLLMIFNRNFSYLTLSLLIMCPIVYFTLPRNALERILSLKIFDGVSIISYVDETREGFRLLLEKPFGIGSGSEIFNEVFNVSSGYVDNVIIQILLEYGIVAFVGILIFGIMLIRLTFSYCSKAKNQYRKINCCAGFCALTGLVIAGGINYTWYDKRIFFMFWILVALSFAYIRIEREDEEPEGLIDDHAAATIDIVIDENSHTDDVPKRRYVHAPKKSSAKAKVKSNDAEKTMREEEFEQSTEYTIVSRKDSDSLGADDNSLFQLRIDDMIPNAVNNANTTNTTADAAGDE